MFVLVTVMSVNLSNAQINPSKKIDTKPKFKIKDKIKPTPLTINKPLDFAAIKRNIENGRCYSLMATATYLEYSQSSRSILLKQGYSISSLLLKSERNYLRSNGLILLSENRFSRVAGNNFEVILFPVGSQFNPNNIKVTWHFNQGGLKTFLLEDVQIIKSNTGITITGHKTIEGKQIAFSIAIGEDVCLI